MRGHSIRGEYALPLANWGIFQMPADTNLNRILQDYNDSLEQYPVKNYIHFAPTFLLSPPPHPMCAVDGQADLQPHQSQMGFGMIPHSQHVA